MRAEIIHADNGLPVACIEVDRNLQIVSSIQGAGQRRLKADGTPEVVPLFPSRFVSRLSQLRNYDYSAQPARNHDWTTGILRARTVARQDSSHQFRRYIAAVR